MIKRTLDSGTKVFLFDDLNPEDAAMVQALLARSPLSVEEHLKKVYAARRAAFDVVLNDCGNSFSHAGALEAIMDIAGHSDASAQARRILSSYFVGYNHRSIADCGFSTIVCEDVSMLAAKAIQDWALYAGQETSTRVLDFSKRRVVNPIGTQKSQEIIARWLEFYVKHQAAVADEVRRRYPRQPGEDEATYEKAISARRFDIMRAWLCAGSTTQLSCTMTLRQFGDKITPMQYHPLAEVRDLTKDGWQSMFCERYTSSGTFGGAAGVSGVGVEKDPNVQWQRDMYNQTVAAFYTYQRPKKLRDWKTFQSTLDLSELLETENGRGLLAERRRGCLLPPFIGDMGQISAVFPLDFGSFRDIQRQRNPPPRMPLLTTKLGFENWYLEQLPKSIRDEAIVLLMRQEVALSELEREGASLEDLQYLTAMGYRVNTSVTFGLPAFVYVCELRTSPFVHPTLRTAVLEHMVRPFEEMYPEVTLHVDKTPDPWDIRRGNQTITERK